MGGCCVPVRMMFLNTTEKQLTKVKRPSLMMEEQPLVCRQ
jgi:hypothetical protein